jgi:hypothetical protein
MAQIETAQHSEEYPFTIDLTREDYQGGFLDWTIKLAIVDKRYEGRYYGAYLSPFQALKLAAELTEMASEQLRTYTEGAEAEITELRKLVGEDY